MRTDAARLARKIIGTANSGPILRRHRGTIVEVNDDGTVDLTLNGSSTVITNIRAIDSLVNILVGDVVEIVIDDTDIFILGRISTEPKIVQPGLQDILYYTSNDTFRKSDYPEWLRAIRARVQAGGGAGGGAVATGASGVSAGAGGTAGAYAESFITIGNLADEETITVGAGGTAVSGAAGGNGGQSSFGSLVTANGGGGGGIRTNTTADWILFQTPISTSTGTGNLVVSGAAGIHATAFRGSSGLTRAMGGAGGTAHLGGGGRGLEGSSNPGGDGGDYGGGGGGAGNQASQSAQPGGNGGDGIVIIELYG